MGAPDDAANETKLQTQLKAEKLALLTRHTSAELADAASADNAVVKFGRSAGRKTEYALFIVKKSLLNMPGCATGRSGCVSVKAKVAEGVDMVKAQTNSRQVDH